MFELKIGDVNNAPPIIVDANWYVITDSVGPNPPAPNYPATYTTLEFTKDAVPVPGPTATRTSFWGSKTMYRIPTNTTFSVTRK